MNVNNELVGQDIKHGDQIIIKAIQKIRDILIIDVEHDRKLLKTIIVRV